MLSNLIDELPAVIVNLTVFLATSLATNCRKINVKVKKSFFVSRLPFIIIVLYMFDVFSPELKVQTDLLSLDLKYGLERQGGASFFKQIFWLSSIIITLLLCHLEKVRVFYNPQLVLALLLIFAMVLLSVIWSEYPLITFKRAAFQVIFVTTVFLASLLLKTKENLFNAFYWSLWIVLLLEVFFAVFMSHISFAYSGEFRGIHRSKNICGVVAFVGYIVSLNQYFYKKQFSQYRGLKPTLIASFIWLVLLILSQSKTCLLLAVICSVSFLSKVYAEILFSITRKLAKRINLVLLISVFCGFLFFNDVLSFFKLIFSSVDLTGRGIIWEKSLESISLSPLVGSGYGAFWGTGKVPELFDVEFSFLPFINQAHNGYIDLMLQLGIIGLILFMYLVYVVAVKLKKVSNYKHLLFSFFLFTMLHNITESSFLRDTALTWFIFVIVVVCLNLGNLEAGKKENF